MDVEIIGLQKMMKLVSHRLETQADTTLHVSEYCSQHGRRDHRLREMARTGQAGTGSVYTGLPTFIFINI
jgi:hypothetical protein